MGGGGTLIEKMMKIPYSVQFHGKDPPLKPQTKDFRWIKGALFDPCSAKADEN